MDTNTIAAIGLLLTFLGSIVKQYFDSRATTIQWNQKQKELLQQRAWDEEDRVRVKSFVGDVKALRDHGDILAKGIEEGKVLTIKAIDGAHEAYVEANTINQKLEKIGTTRNEQEAVLKGSKDSADLQPDQPRPQQKGDSK